MMANNVWLVCKCVAPNCDEIIPVRSVQPHELDAAGEIDLPLVGHQLVCRRCGFSAFYSTRQMSLVRMEGKEGAP